MGVSAAIKPTPITNDKADDFVLVCPSRTGIAEAIHALYYLPENYRLIVLSKAAQDVSLPFEGGIMDRVAFEKAGLSDETASFSSALIYGESDKEVQAAKTPWVVISNEADGAIESKDWNGFKVSADNPEALATAVMRIARYAQAA